MLSWWRAGLRSSVSGPDSPEGFISQGVRSRLLWVSSGVTGPHPQPGDVRSCPEMPLVVTGKGVLPVSCGWELSAWPPWDRDRPSRGDSAGPGPRKGCAVALSRQPAPLFALARPCKSE